MRKYFNVTGKCFPEEHYMVNIDDKLEKIKAMVDRGNYFCINRGRQFGKTTTFSLLKNKLEQDYIVYSISLESIGDDDGENIQKLTSLIFGLMSDSAAYGGVKNISKETYDYLSKISCGYSGVRDINNAITTLVSMNNKPVVLLIDEVDQAGNFASFIQFLSVLRNKFLQRHDIKTFHSVVLAGVYDIKNLKLKLRPEEQHQYNSPWNIAVNFDVDMSLGEAGIAGMLEEYAQETCKLVNVKEVAKIIRDYTSGYPFLVSRLCQLMDEKSFTWNKAGVLDAVKLLLKESNTLFDDMTKKLNQFPELKKMLYDILYNGQRYSYNPDNRSMDLAIRFGYLRDDNGSIVVANRIFETRLYNRFASEEETERIYTEGTLDKNQFVKNGKLDMEHILEKFVIHFNSIYNAKDGRFVESMGRKLFLLYLRPIINGVGNYYIEAETRDATRTDVIVDYLGHQYVIELKIWRGESYNERGESQLAEYLEYYGLTQGYMLSFCFNKDKKCGVRRAKIKDMLLFEAIV